MGFSITQFYIDKIPSIIRITDKYFHHGSPTMGFSITQFYIDKITSIIRMISHSTFCRTWGDIGASCQFYQLKQFHIQKIPSIINMTNKYFHHGSPTMGFSKTQCYIDKIPSIISLMDKYFHHGSPTMGFSITQFYIDKIPSIIRMTNKYFHHGSPTMGFSITLRWPLHDSTQPWQHPAVVSIRMILTNHSLWMRNGGALIHGLNLPSITQYHICRTWGRHWGIMPVSIYRMSETGCFSGVWGPNGSPTKTIVVLCIPGQFYIDKIPSIIRMTDKHFHHGSPTMGFSITQFYIDKIPSISRMTRQIFSLW